MICPSKESALECRGIKEMVRNLIREHFEMGHRSDSGKRQKTSVTETVRNSGENKYQVPITACKEQTKVKIIEEDKNSELEVLNNSGEEYIRQELEKLSKIAAENVQISKNLSKKTEEEGNISCTDLPTVAEECVETVAEECVETVAEECVETVAEECVETVAEECVETVAEECVETVAEECVETVAEECVETVAEECVEMVAEECVETVAEECVEMVAEECVK
ncbi:hypothetical protein TNCT_172721 [Trichonephila clavata]|uniref:Uncharacterized protein n=1 Tax=Trichonephila clavata TaxID=2740835 RepID=A0A8X6JIL5_TRICU|nr:hypothetical protein TNCT_172721 [Trichonephila clavata]